MIEGVGSNECGYCQPRLHQLAGQGASQSHPQRSGERILHSGAICIEQKRSLTREEKEFADLLTLLIEDFEERRYQLPAATSVQALSFLMEQRGLKQKDLADIFGARSLVSEVMNGKGELT
jgi:antitoxin component HigA of HigAB toxin-antitoxin module